MKIPNPLLYFVRRFGVGAKNNQSIDFPGDVLCLIKEGRAYRLAGFIDWLSRQEKREGAYLDLRRRVEKEGWDELEKIKLDAYKAYYDFRYQDAYRLVESYIDPHSENFDPDCGGVAMQCLFNTNQYDRAYRYLRLIEHREAEMLGNVGYQVAAALICWSAGDRYRTNRYVDISISSMTEQGLAVFNAVGMYFELGDMTGLGAADKILRGTCIDDPAFNYTQAFMTLAENNYRAGFELAEARYGLPEAHRYLRKELLSQPRATMREEIVGKILLIHGEQGLGDMIQTARYFGECLELAKQVIIECPHESIALLKHNFPVATFVPLHWKNPVDLPYDVWAGTLSLPYILRTDENNIPHKNGYLNVPAEHFDYWSKRVEEQTTRSSGLKVGLAWSGFPGHRADRRRSLPWNLVKILVEQNKSIDFFAVQIAVPDDLPDNLHDCTDEMATLCDTAALVKEMDLIITVDTSVVHIAGALGKETWMMLPYRYEWRWGLEGESNCWYDSVKVIRQPSPGAWAPALSQVFGRRLRDYVNKHGR